MSLFPKVFAGREVRRDLVANRSIELGDVVLFLAVEDSPDPVLKSGIATLCGCRTDDPCIRLMHEAKISIKREEIEFVLIDEKWVRNKDCRF